MKHAVQNDVGQWTGSYYDQVTPAIRAHHAQYGETIAPVADLQNIGSDDAPEWVAEPVALEDLRATMVVSRFQARAALIQAGLIDAAAAAIRASGDAMLAAAWDHALEFRRLSPAIVQMGGALQLSDEAVDALFASAALITA